MQVGTGWKICVILDGDIYLQILYVDIICRYYMKILYVAERGFFPMIIFLTSSPTGPLDHSRETNGLDWMNYFQDNLRRYWKQPSRCLMVAAFPDAYEQNDTMSAYFHKVFEQAGLSCLAFDLLDNRVNDMPAFLADIKNYDLIVLAGGHVPTQNAFFKRIGLANYLKDYPGMVMGISAGTMNSASTVYVQPEEEGEAVDPSFHRFEEGLALTDRMLLPHYQMVKDDVIDGLRLFEDVTYGDSFGREFIAMEDGSYLLSLPQELYARDFGQEGKVCQVNPYGQVEILWGTSYEIRDGEIRMICPDGEHIVL